MEHYFVQPTYTPDLYEEDVCIVNLSAWQEHIETQGIPHKVDVIKAINCAVHATYADGSLWMPVTPSKLLKHGLKPQEEAVMEEFGLHITAVLMVESNLRHLKDDGTVKRGDSGKSIGIGQVQHSWVKWFKRTQGLTLDRYTMSENIELCARILLYHGWKYNDEDAQNHAFTGYNTGDDDYVYRVYVDKVRKNINLMMEAE